MDERGYSQVPVVRDGMPQGLIGNNDIRQRTGDNVGDLPVADVMHESIALVEPTATIDEIDAYLNHNAAVLVGRRAVRPSASSPKPTSLPTLAE